MAKHVVLSGASGFLGGHLVRGLIGAGYRVTGLVRRQSDLSRISGLPIELVHVDVPGELEAIDKASVFAAIHTATNYGRDGATSADLVRDNLLYPLRILAQLSPDTPFVNTDSFFSKPSLSNGTLAGYTLCKRQLLDWLNFDPARAIVNVRLEHLFGPFDSDRKFIPHMLTQLLANTPSIDLSDGKQTRDFVFVDDVVGAYLAVLAQLPQLPPGVQEVEVGTGRATSVRSFIERMKHVTHSDSHLDFGARPQQPGEIQHSHADTSQLLAWGWTPTWSHERALQACVTQLVEQKQSS